jgi:hypothetical protein
MKLVLEMQSVYRGTHMSAAGTHSRLIEKMLMPTSTVTAAYHTRLVSLQLRSADIDTLTKHKLKKVLMCLWSLVTHLEITVWQ